MTLEDAASGRRWMERWTPDGCDLARKQQQVETRKGRSWNLDRSGFVGIWSGDFTGNGSSPGLNAVRRVELSGLSSKEGIHEKLMTVAAAVG